MATIEIEIHKRLIKKRHLAKKFTQELNESLTKKYLTVFHDMNTETYFKLRTFKSRAAQEMQLKKMEAINKHYTFISK